MMTRGRIPVAEVLEGRTLLSAISYSLTATPASASPGQPIVFEFTETNTSDQPVTVDVETPDFQVSQNGFALWQSAAAGTSPSITSETLQPGQSVQQSATWDGAYSNPYYIDGGTSGPVNTYTYNAFGNLNVTNINDPQGSSATFAIPDPVTETVTTDRSVYQLGEPITATFTVVNTASIPVSVWDPLEGVLEIYRTNGTPVQIVPQAQNISNSPTTLSPGQVVTETQTFTLVPSVLPPTYANLSGTFFAGFGFGTVPAVDSVPFQVVAPTGIVSRISTDRTSVDPGQTVNLTFTETNEGTQPAVILAGPTQFEISAGGKLVWYSPVQEYWDPTWVMLAPGQSYSQTGSWSGETSSGLKLPESIINGQSTTVSITNTLDLNGDTASLQLNVAGAEPAPVSAAISAQLKSVQHTYKTGHTVELSLVLKNKGAAKVALKPDAGLDRIMVLDGSKVVYQSNVLHPKLSARSIKPRETTTLAVTWSGRANQAGVGKLAPGRYTVEVMEDGYVGTTTVRLVR